MQPLYTSFIPQNQECKIKNFDNYSNEKIKKKIKSIIAIQRSIGWNSEDLYIASRRMYNAKDLKFFLKKDKKVIGYAILTSRDSTTWYLSQIAVHLQYKRQGHGKNLMNHIFTQARASYIHSIDLDMDLEKPGLY